MNRALLIPLIVALVAVVLFVMVSSTLTTVWVFIPGIIITLVLYLNTYYHRAPNPEKILPFYLLLLGVQFIHFTEEYLTGFTIEIPRLLGQPAYPQDYWVVFNMIAYFIFVLGGIIIYKRFKELLIIPMFFILVGVLFNSIVHILISLYVKAYFPGLYTALIYAVLGPLFIRMASDEIRDAKAN